MSSTIKLHQRLAELSKQLTQHDLTDDERDDIEAEIEQIEFDIDEEINHHHGEDYA
jgi:flagellin-like hook-associated protein FlgL